MSSEQSDICIELQPQIAAYALGEAEAEADLLMHLRRCAACRRDLEAYRRVAHALVYDAPQVEPPARLREQIIAAATPTASGPADPAPPVVRPRFGFGFVAPAFALAIVVLVALLFWNISLQQQIDAQAARLVSSRENWRLMTQLLNAPDIEWYQLEGEQAVGHIWFSDTEQLACLVAEDLPPLERDQVYQVWLTEDGQRVSGGTFNARDGSAWILISTDEPPSHYDTVGVTIEPRGGSPGPTGPRVLLGQIEQPG